MKWLSSPGNYSPPTPSEGHPIPPATARLLAGLAPPPAAGADAALLARYVRTRDPAAFTELVRRHAPAVRAVARARLHDPADADDVTQATFLVLARDAGRVRGSVAGWLVRVAHLSALQLRRNQARRRAGPLPDDLGRTDDPAAAASLRERRAAVAEELAGLPDRLRAVLVLCTLDGLTAAAAAVRLGVPKGTVDSRLATAKRRLAARLVRRGVGAASLAGLVADAPAGCDVAAIAATAVAYAGAGLSPSPVSLLADGVRPVMTRTARLFAVGLVAAGLAGSTGTALLSGGPADDPKPPAKAAPPPKKPAEPAVAPDAAPPAVVADEPAARTALGRPAPADVSAMSVRDLFDWLFKQYGLVVRIDLADCDRVAPFPEDQRAGLYDRKLQSPLTRGMSVADLLAEVAGLFDGPDQSRRYAFRVRAGQVLMVPAFMPAGMPGGGEAPDFQPMVPTEVVAQQLLGEPVSIDLESSTLRQAVDRLRRQTGANIVVDPRAGERAGERVGGAFDDVRLLHVLRLVSNMAGLEVVVMGNVYYLTDPANAARQQKVADRDRKYVPADGRGAAADVPVPAGFVTDGYQYFPRTADMKPVQVPGLGAGGGGAFGGGGGFGGAGPQTVPGVQPVPALKK